MAPPRGNENSGGAFFMRNVNMFKRGRWQRWAHNKCFKHARLQCEQVMPLIWVGASQLVDLSGAHVKWPPPFFCRQTATYMFPKVYNFQIQQKKRHPQCPILFASEATTGMPPWCLGFFLPPARGGLFSSVHIGKIIQTFGNMRFQASGQIQRN